MPGLAKKIIDAVLGERAEEHFPGDRFALDASLHVRPCGSFLVGDVLRDRGRAYNIGHSHGGMRKRMDMVSREPIFHVHCELANILDLGSAPFGHRRVVNLLGGTVTGAKLQGPAGAGVSWRAMTAERRFTRVLSTGRARTPGCT